MTPLDGENLMVNKWPPSLPAALQRWGTSQPKSPCLTALDNAGKAVYTLTYGRRSFAVQKTVPKFSSDRCNNDIILLSFSFFFVVACVLLYVDTLITMFGMLNYVGKLWTRSQKLAYTLLHKLSTRNEPLLVPGDRVSHSRRKMHILELQIL